MTDQPKNEQDKTDVEGSFDLAQLRELIEMMEEHDVTEVNLKQGNQQWRLRRGPNMVPVASAPVMPAPAATPQPAAPAPSGGSAPAESAAAAPASDGGMVIKSPTVGTFYSSPSPDDPAFVKVGSKVSPDTVVCLIEAMKVFNEIPAECSGTISEILVKDGDAIEFDQPLYRVNPG